MSTIVNFVGAQEFQFGMSNNVGFKFFIKSTWVMVYPLHFRQPQKDIILVRTRPVIPQSNMLKIPGNSPVGRPNLMGCPNLGRPNPMGCPNLGRPSFWDVPTSLGCPNLGRPSFWDVPTWDVPTSLGCLSQPGMSQLPWDVPTWDVPAFGMSQPGTSQLLGCPNLGRPSFWDVPTWDVPAFWDVPTWDSPAFWDVPTWDSPAFWDVPSVDEMSMGRR
ncbi:hypothetical protein DFJ43DRAFT_1157883 [Lentinula guzmanii]|uniref:Uncharacterized protein n=1 Tax=Lentinula guzmanii TaxID=2804957 RepID=A0AA38J585_9AGAR|nr:hypothetical protein DFJ43DRAFT_1157883 [Lentinula guzmanii]